MAAIGTVAATAMALVPASDARADGTVVVHGLAFPEGRDAQLSFVGCDALYQRSDEPVQAYIGRGRVAPPAGERSLGYDLRGGNAIGALYYVSSMAGTTAAGLSVSAPSGASGVAYAGYQAPADAGTPRVWFGRAPLSAGPGWQGVDATGLTYTWTQYDMSTQQVLDQAPEPAAVSAFMGEHGGDGPGLYTVGFGCDGAPFDMDAWRIGGAGDVTTYDLEGYSTATTMSGSAQVVAAGEPVTL